MNRSHSSNLNQHRSTQYDVKIEFSCYFLRPCRTSGVVLFRPICRRSKPGVCFFSKVVLIHSTGVASLCPRQTRNFQLVGPFEFLVENPFNSETVMMWWLYRRLWMIVNSCYLVATAAFYTEKIGRFRWNGWATCRAHIHLKHFSWRENGFSSYGNMAIKYSSRNVWRQPSFYIYFTQCGTDGRFREVIRKETSFGSKEKVTRNRRTIECAEECRGSNRNDGCD